VSKSKKPVRRKGDRKRQPPNAPSDDGMVMEYQFTDRIRKLKLHQTFGSDLDNLYATDTMIIGAEGLSGYHKPILTQLTKSIGATGKIARWLRRSGQGPIGTRLYVEMRGKVTHQMAKAFREACFQIWNGQRDARKFHGITIDSEGGVTWWNPWEVVRRHTRRSKR